MHHNHSSKNKKNICRGWRFPQLPKSMVWYIYKHFHSLIYLVCNIQGIVIWCKTNVCLLFAIRPAGSNKAFKMHHKSDNAFPLYQWFLWEHFRIMIIFTSFPHYSTISESSLDISVEIDKATFQTLKHKLGEFVLNFN